MDRLLAVCTLPIWPVRDGYSLRAANLLEALARRWRVALLAPGAPPPGVMEHLPLALEGSGLSYPWRFDNGPLVAAIERGVAAVRPACALVWPGGEGAWLAGGSRVPAVLDMIDCNPLEFGRAAWAGRGRDRIWNLREAFIAAVHARRAVRGFGATVCVGGADAAWMARVAGRAVHDVPNGVALPRSAVPENPCATVMFSGTLDYAPNIDAVAFMAAEIWPRIRAVLPAARWVVAGRRPVAAIRTLDGHHGIEVRADVADMAAELQSAWVAIAPMRRGVGLKNKVLEAWASARPVVLTPLAMNGLTLPPGHAGLVQAGAAGLVAAAVALLQDSAARRRLGTAAQAMVAGDFAWAAAGDRLDAVLRRVMRRA